MTSFLGRYQNSGEKHPKAIIMERSNQRRSAQQQSTPCLKESVLRKARGPQKVGRVTQSKIVSALRRPKPDAKFSWACR
jgi:hypothetical protein